MFEWKKISASQKVLTPFPIQSIFLIRTDHIVTFHFVLLLEAKVITWEESVKFFESAKNELGPLQNHVKAILDGITHWKWKSRTGNARGRPTK